VRIGVADSSRGLNVLIPPFDDDEIVSDVQNAVAAGTVLADSGQLAQGKFMVRGGFGQTDNGVRFIDLEWRNAANTATIATFHHLHGALQNGVEIQPLILTMATDERVRWVANTAIALIVHTWIATTQTFAATA